MWSASCWPANWTTVPAAGPSPLRPALGSPTFAAELRDLLLRTAERGIAPGRLAELGRRRRRPEWQAVARFAREYQDVADLRQGTVGLGPALDQAELTRAALALLTDDQVLADEQGRLRRLFVDEYQDVDPAQVRLIERLSSGATSSSWSAIPTSRSTPSVALHPVRCGRCRLTTRFR